MNEPETRQVPVIAVTLGDPAGVGPEVVVGAMAAARPVPCRPVVIGSRRVVERALEPCGVSLEILPIESPERATGRDGTLELIDMDNVDVDELQVGRIQPQCGRAAFEYIERASHLALSGEVDAVATAPINKESLKAGEVPYLDHTAMFGAFTRVADPLTMFDTRGLRVFFLSRHVPLRKACDMVTVERLVDYSERCLAALERIGFAGGTLAIAALNPHGGEGGMFGHEEQDQIVPAVAQARARGLRVEGPIPADSVFHLAHTGRFTAVLSLYHDQGHIATKTLDFERTVALTLGMPFLRTSVDHGTAFDIAGKGEVSPVSMVEAIAAAARYARPVRAERG
jgi:4-hydroxythreonine-4-phosphate dehydrogenase